MSLAKKIQDRRFRYVSFEIAANYQRQIMDLDSGVDTDKEQFIFDVIVPRWMEKNLTEEQKKWFERKELRGYMNLWTQQWNDVKEIFPTYFAPPVDEMFIIEGEDPSEPQSEYFWEDAGRAYEEEYDVDCIEMDYDDEDNLIIVGEEEPPQIYCYFVPDWDNKKKMSVQGFEWKEVPFEEGVDPDISDVYVEEYGGFYKVLNAIGINGCRPDVYEYTRSEEDLEIVNNELKWYNFVESDKCTEPILITADKRKFIGKKVEKEEETYPMEIVIFTWA